MELQTKTIGHYPEGRSDSKGNEPENIGYGVFGGTPYIFVISERSSVVFVYDATDPTSPVFTQVLPTGSGPEGEFRMELLIGLSMMSRGLQLV
jgi:hypothetical protein